MDSVTPLTGDKVIGVPKTYTKDRPISKKFKIL